MSSGTFTNWPSGLLPPGGSRFKPLLVAHYEYTVTTS